MVDVAKLSEEIGRQRDNERTGTLGNLFDFDRLREVNTDESGVTINPHVEVFLDWAESLLNRIPQNWSEFLPQVPADLKSLFDEIDGILNRIQSAETGSLAARGTALSAHASAVQSVMGRTVNSIKDLLFLQMIGDERRSKTKHILERVATAEAEVLRTLANATEKADQLAEMVSASQEATAKVAASGRARIFHIEGVNFRDAARRWLGATVVLGATLIGLAFGFAFGWIDPISSTATNAQIASYLFGKLLILGTMGGAVTFSARQYSANKHNAVQNFHRSSALRTYRALLAASRDEAVHEAMLHQAALAIFSPADTGYLKQKSGSETAPLLQLFQGAAKDAQRATPPGA